MTLLPSKFVDLKFRSVAARTDHGRFRTMSRRIDERGEVDGPSRAAPATRGSRWSFGTALAMGHLEVRLIARLVNRPIPLVARAHPVLQRCPGRRNWVRIEVGRALAVTVRVP